MPTDIRKGRKPRVHQGDVFRDIDFFEYAVEKKGVVEIARIEFPYVVVLTQDCDLEQDHSNRARKGAPSQDKHLFSVLVAPVYNAEHIYTGEHLSELGLKMSTINRRKGPGDRLRSNQVARYHYLDFATDAPIVPSVVDFKHYFSVNIEYLRRARPGKFVCRLAPLHREDLLQRYSAFLSRIGLP